MNKLNKPFLLYGGSSKNRKDWAQEISDRNRWRLYEIDKKTFREEIHKSSITTSISTKPNIIFVNKVDEMPVKDLEKLFELIENSPHRIVFEAKSIARMGKKYKDRCSLIRIGIPMDDNFFLVLDSILKEPDRDKVRKQIMEYKDKVHVYYHILKNNVWKSNNPRVFDAIERGLQMFYKVNNDYLISLLAYRFPVSGLSLSYDKKRKIYKEEENILKKMRSKLRLSKVEAVETYGCVREIIKHPPPNFALRLIKDLNLEKKEIEFLGLQLPVATKKVSSHKAKSSKASVASHPPPRINNLSKWI